MLAQMPSLTVSRIQPEQLNGRTLVKLVYVVLEPQYQSAVAAGAENINLKDKHVAMDVRGYLIEELRDPERYEEFKRDVAEADIFFASMIFMEDYANKIVDAVKPHMDHIKSSVIFPSMPQVMRLSKVGAFSMGAMGQSKSVIGKFMKSRKEASKNKRGGSFQDAEDGSDPAQDSQISARRKSARCPQLHAQLPVLAGWFSREHGTPAADAHPSLYCRGEG
jgi:magnesium chelatase subunit H